MAGIASIEETGLKYHLCRVQLVLCRDKHFKSLALSFRSVGQGFGACRKWLRVSLLQFYVGLVNELVN